MKTLRECLAAAREKKVAIGHFNFSNLEGLWAIVRAARELRAPVIVGLSEGERDFVGGRQAAALVNSFRNNRKDDPADWPIFLNADHTYSFERVREAIDLGFDSVIFDGSQLSLEENIKETKKCVEYARSVGREVIVEGEIGYIGTSSKILTELPTGVSLNEKDLPGPETARRFVEETEVDLLAPAVGNIHGMFKVGGDPALQIDLIKKISAAACPPAMGLVLHGASGNTAEDIRAAIAAGVTMVHVNTELRVAYRDALKLALQENPDEVAPYKILKSASAAMEKVVAEKLKLFNNL